MSTARLALLPLLLAALSIGAETTPIPTSEKKTMHVAKGEFDVQVTPRSLDGGADDPSLSRYALTKQLRGDLVATGAGQMLASSGAAANSGAYVAIERITGKLAGREGSFVLQHRGVMDSTGMSLEVTIVPESGTEGFAGIRGTFRILFEGPKHLYELEYELPGN